LGKNEGKQGGYTRKRRKKYVIYFLGLGEYDFPVLEKMKIVKKRLDRDIGMFISLLKVEKSEAMNKKSEDIMWMSLEVTCGFRREELVVRSRVGELVFPRQLGMWWMVRHGGFTLEAAGGLFGLDHSTALHAARKIDNMIVLKDKKYLGRIDRFMKVVDSLREGVKSDVVEGVIDIVGGDVRLRLERGDGVVVVSERSMMFLRGGDGYVESLTGRGVVDMLGVIGKFFGINNK
jgi:hypothetical protein